MTKTTRHWMQSGDLVVAGHRLIKHVDSARCEHVAVVDDELVDTAEYELAGYVRVFRRKDDCSDRSMRAGSGLNLYPAPQ